MAKIPPMEIVRASIPVNRDARMGISHREYQEVSSKPSRFEFLSETFRREVRDQPASTAGYLTGHVFGQLRVMGYLDSITRKALKWPATAVWLVKCQCGRYESRRASVLRQSLAKKPHLNACTYCKNAFAELAKQQYLKSGVVPHYGVPTHKASKIIGQRLSKKVVEFRNGKPVVRVKMGRGVD